MNWSEKFYGINFALFPHRGVLSSETARRSMAEMAEKTGANWVILSPGGVQQTPYSEEIDWRGEATPADEELCSAIRFAKQLGLKTALKPTVNCANGVWRARISFLTTMSPARQNGAAGLQTIPRSRPITRPWRRPKAAACF